MITKHTHSCSYIYDINASNTSKMLVLSVQTTYADGQVWLQ